MDQRESASIIRETMPQRERVARAANPTKPRIFLADLEYAKKEEYERRRKLRLKQVRQQARDIASVIRAQAVNARKHEEIARKCEQLNRELASEEGKKAELENKLSECFTVIGTAHSSAMIMSEVDELARHKAELQRSLAQLRAELASEKSKEHRKPRPDVAENLQEGINISKVASGIPTVRPAVKKYFPALESGSSSYIAPATPPNLVSEKRPGESRESIASEPPAEKTIFSPPRAGRARSAQEIEKHLDESYPDGRKSCPPEREVVDDVSSDSDSGQTWPPASVKKKKSSKVRMYNHSARKCTEYVQQCSVVRMETPEGLNMKELIREEEHLLSKKADEEQENRRVELQRGVRALREEVAKQDWDSAISKLCQFAKEKRIKKSLMYPIGPDQEETQAGSGKDAPPAPETGPSDVPKDTAQRSGSDKEPAEPLPPDTKPGDKSDDATKRPPVKEVCSTLSSIMSRFNRQREAVLEDRSLSTESAGSESESDDIQLPLWMRTEVDAQNSTVRESGGHPGRVGTPETQMERRRQSSSTSPESLGSSLEPPSPKTAAKGVALDGERVQAESSIEMNNSTSEGDINIEIRFKKSVGTEVDPGTSIESKGSSPKLHQDGKSSTPPFKDSSSTSYYSPPGKLSPQQLSLLSGILSRMSVKNRNPVLHHYINRVLEMSRRSVSDLDVSSSSELTIPSDLIKKSFGSRAADLRRSSPQRDGISSRAVSVSSDPRDSVGDVSSSDNAAEIAALLRNIAELQRLYRSAASSSLSDSRSSYRSVANRIGSDRCDQLDPEIGPLTNFCEETGIFENTSWQPMFSIFDKGQPDIGIPSELFPKPVFSAPPDRPPSAENDERRFDDVPDGYAMRPEHHPTSLKLPTVGIRRVISSLSDIESDVSSIPGSPSKSRLHSPSKSLRPTSPASADDKESTVSGISASDFIDSEELRNNDLIGPSSSSTSDFEDVFQSLGLGWALTTLRRIRNARNLPADDSSKTTTDVGSSLTSSSSRSKPPPSFRHSTPVKPKTRPKPVVESSDTDGVPSLTPPNLALLCPTLQN